MLEFELLKLNNPGVKVPTPVDHCVRGWYSQKIVLLSLYSFLPFPRRLVVPIPNYYTNVYSKD